MELDYMQGLFCHLEFLPHLTLNSLALQQLYGHFLEAQGVLEGQEAQVCH